MSQAATARLHLLERWRARLLADETALAELAAAYPGCDTQRLRQLVRNAHKEAQEQRPPRSARRCFKRCVRSFPIAG